MEGYDAGAKEFGKVMDSANTYRYVRYLPEYLWIGWIDQPVACPVRLHTPLQAAEIPGPTVVNGMAVALPIATLAASGIANFKSKIKLMDDQSPLRRTVTTGEVGNAALFLLSDLGRAVTGECLHVDAGYHLVGMKAEDAPDISVSKNNGE